MQLKNTISNKRSHLVAKAKEIVVEAYSLDGAPQETKSTITWLVEGFRFMHRDPVVCPWLLDFQPLQLLIRF